MTLDFQNTALIYSTLGLVFILLAYIVFSIVLKNKKEKGFLAKSLNLSLFSVTLPQREKEEGVKITLEEHLKTAEQFYSSLAGIKEHNFLKRILFGNPSFVFEIAVHRIGEEIYFYVAAPRSISGLIEKEILAFWPKAQIQPATDYNVFNPSGATVGNGALLAKSAILPLKNYKEFSTDPLSAITSVFTKLAKEGEGAAIQVLIRLSKSSLKATSEKAIKSIYEKGKIAGNSSFMHDVGATLFQQAPKANKEQQMPASAPSLGPLQQNTITAISEKASQPLFDVNLRMVASASTEDKAQSILEQMQSAFEQFGSPVLNQFKFKKIKGGKLKKLFYNFSFRLFKEKESMLLSSGELASIFHFPSSDLSTPHIKWLKVRQAPPPANMPEEGLIVGKNVFRDQEREVRILDDDRRRHFYAIGQTGTGKSVLLQEMIRQDIEAGKGVCLIDPHGDLAEKVLSLIPASRAEDVIYFNPGDIDRPLGLNMLEFDPNFPESKTFVVNEIIEIFEKLYNLKALGFGGPIFEQYMRNALLLIMEDPESGSTMVEIPRVLSDVEFRKYKLSKCKNVVVKNFWEKEAEKAGGEAALANMVPYITSKMNVFIANDLVRPIISQQKSAFNIREVMDSGKILIINLSKGKLGDMNSYLLGMIIVGKILIASFSRADMAEEKRRDFYLYIDEFHNVTTQTITKALAEARKYRLNMIFSHQYIGQLDEETQKAIFGNVGSMMAFRVGPDDAKYLMTGFAPVFDEEDLVSIDNYNAVLRLLIKGETSKPFNIVTYPPSKGNPKVAELIKEYCRVKYGKNRVEVEEDLYSRLQKTITISFASFNFENPKIENQPETKPEEIKIEEVKKEETLRTSFEVKGENFSAERLTNPEDPRIEQIQRLFESHFSKDELDSIDVMKQAMTGKMPNGEKIPPYLVNVVENSKGEVKGVSTGAVVEMVDKDGNVSEKSGVALGCYFLTSIDVRGRIAIPIELFKLQELSAKQDAESRGLEVKGFLAEAQNDVEKPLNTRGAERLYIKTKEGYKEVQYEQPPLDWNPKTGKPAEDAGVVPEHLMLKLASGEKKLPGKELMEMVRGMYSYNNYRGEEDFKSQKAFDAHNAYMEAIEQKLADFIGRRQVHLLSAKEREVMTAKGTQFFEHKTEVESKEK